jgi:Protein of unknown function (DUF669)
MANLGMLFNADDYQPLSEWQPLPAGSYVMQAFAAELKPTRAGTGEFLEVQFEVMEGEHASRKHYERFNLTNANAQAQEIGRRQFADFMRACGVTGTQESDDLLFIPVRAEVKVKQRKDDPTRYDNEVRYFPLNEGSAPAQKPQGAPQTPTQRRAAATTAARPSTASTAAPGAGGKPWERHRRTA